MRLWEEIALEPGVCAKPTKGHRGWGTCFTQKIAQAEGHQTPLLSCYGTHKTPGYSIAGH